MKQTLQYCTRKILEWMQDYEEARISKKEMRKKVTCEFDSVLVSIKSKVLSFCVLVKDLDFLHIVVDPKSLCNLFGANDCHQYMKFRKALCIWHKNPLKKNLCSLSLATQTLSQSWQNYDYVYKTLLDFEQTIANIKASLRANVCKIKERSLLQSMLRPQAIRKCLRD